MNGPKGHLCVQEALGQDWGHWFSRAAAGRQVQEPGDWKFTEYHGKREGIKVKYTRSERQQRFELMNG